MRFMLINCILLTKPSDYIPNDDSPRILHNILSITDWKMNWEKYFIINVNGRPSLLGK